MLHLDHLHTAPHPTHSLKNISLFWFEHLAFAAWVHCHVHTLLLPQFFADMDMLTSFCGLRFHLDVPPTYASSLTHTLLFPAPASCTCHSTKSIAAPPAHAHCHGGSPSITSSMPEHTVHYRPSDDTTRGLALSSYLPIQYTYYRVYYIEHFTTHIHILRLVLVVAL